MAKYKHYDYSQGKFIPISFDKQILPGTFEHTLHYLIDNEIDLSVFDLRYENDETGAPACGPAILLKIVLYAYSRGYRLVLPALRSEGPGVSSRTADSILKQKTNLRFFHISP